MAEPWEPIVLSAKVFGHLSQGLYRTPAGAIKELISNSFDADAKLVKLHSGFPTFETFSCQDNGKGMSEEEFRRLMNRGIGSSYKRAPTQVLTDLGRPVIGRLGLGILSLAQICTRFDIVSHHKESKTAFRAMIKFPPYTRQEMDKIAKKALDDNDEIHGGEFQLVEEKYEAAKQGLRVFTNYLREPFRKRMRNLAHLGNKRTFNRSGPYKTFEQFLDAIYDEKRPVQSLNLISDYDQLLFGLALAAPLPLSDRNLVDQLPLVAERQKKIKQFNFRVQVDNMELENPVSLPSDRAGHIAKQCKLVGKEKREFELQDGPYKETVGVVQHKVDVKGTDDQFNLYELKYSNANVAGMPLEFRGYLFQQTGRLYPRDIQGVLIRLSNVAIGKYDNAMMTYPYAEGPRYAMVSSELFVTRGFEDALNIDRDSFNELHPHYMRTQAFMHSLLHGLIFPETWGEEKQRNKLRRERIAERTETRFVESLRKTTGRKISSISRVERPRSEATTQRRTETPVEYKSTKGEIEIDRSHPLLAPLFKRKKYAPLVEKLVVAFEQANQEGSLGRRREIFYEILADIFSDE